jgi:hypothetical protein
MQVQAVCVVAGHTLEECIAVLGGAETGLNSLACGTMQEAVHQCNHQPHQMAARASSGVP